MFYLTVTFRLSHVIYKRVCPYQCTRILLQLFLEMLKVVLEAQCLRESCETDQSRSEARRLIARVFRDSMAILRYFETRFLCFGLPTLGSGQLRLRLVGYALPILLFLNA